MEIVPPGITTLPTVARHLRLGLRRLHQLSQRTALRRARRVSLGRALGSYRLIPQLGVVALRQLAAPFPRDAATWDAALADVLDSAAWAEATARLAERRPPTGDRLGGAAALERALLASALRPVMTTLHAESLAALRRRGLADWVQSEPLVVDRLEDDDDAVVLVGADRRPFRLARPLLRVAGIEQEKAWGVLVAVRTATGVELDVWPAVGAPATGAPDAELLALRTEVGAR